MNLNNLKTYVPAKLYKRGLDYFEQDFVEQLKENVPNSWKAVVAGTRYYEVAVRLSADGAIEGSYCTCPFESDSLCKHEVAVCLAIGEYKKKNSSAAVDVGERLKALKKAELLEIVEELAEKLPVVTQFLADRFSTADGMDEMTARRIIRESASRASRRGFIEWDRTDQALEGAWEVQGYANGLDPLQYGEKIIRLHLVVIEECSEIMQMADDSSGDISSRMYGSLAKIDETLAEWPEGLDEAIVDAMLELFYPHILFHIEQDITDAAGDLLDSVLQWNERGHFIDKSYDFIERVIVSKEMQNKAYKYTEERFRMKQLEILQERGDQRVVEAFYAKHHGYPAVRKSRTMQALVAGEHEKVIRLCEESERLDANLPGLVYDWKKLRFAAYEGMDSTTEMVDLSMEFALKGEEEYYVKLRSLVDKEQWPDKLEVLLAEMKNSPRSMPLYFRILVDEKRLEELLDYCRTHVSAIEHLYPHLVDDYPYETNELYTTYIYRQIERASNRKAYWSACQIIKNFRDALGAEAAAGLIEELKFMYPKRSALLDELGKIE